jgi:hypothetical protein
MNAKWLKPFFIAAGCYDGILALVFLLFGGAIYEKFGIPPPNHWAYIHFPALLLIVFAIMFFRIASDPVKNRELIWYGIGLKVSYCTVAFGYQLTECIPSWWIPWGWADLVFLALFIYALKITGPVAMATRRA